MSGSIRIALAQVNPKVGDLAGNAGTIITAIAAAKEAGADLIVFPELTICGYPPEDLLTRPSFIRRCAEALRRVAAATDGITALVGTPVAEGPLFNAAAVLADGEIKAYVLKRELPNYGVFDEHRYFQPGDNGPLIRVGEALVGVSICEDIWIENDILRSQAAHGANLFVNLSGSPYRVSARQERRRIVTDIASGYRIPLAYCNLVGGQDELVFDGHSLVVAADGTIVRAGAGFGEELIVVDLPVEEAGSPAGRAVVDGAPVASLKQPSIQTPAPATDNVDDEIYEALVLGVRDYIGKNGFSGAVVALSGGVDSALTVAIAVAALGPDRVRVVMMPSPYSSVGSIADSEKMIALLGLTSYTLPIGPIMAAFDTTLAEAFADTEPNVAEENIQARIRGALIMALSNKFGWITLTTGNKSEMAVGYATLYGDMAGGFAVIKDLFKTRVYSVCRRLNERRGKEIIPTAIIEKEPSAELRPDQKDTDSLPPYDVLDPILSAYVERNMNIDEIVNLGYSNDLVSRVVRMVDRNEYKRRQAPIGVKISVKAFGRDRRHPITCGFIDE
jgi:NAD+ synthase (glutamine-hydrolysing)